MLTVTHIGPNGHEMVVGCDRLVRERRSDGFFQFTALDNDSPPGSYNATWCGDCRPGTPRSLIADHTLYVMNKSGATVATYSFSDPDHGGEQIDPEAVRQGAMSAATVVA